MLFDEEPGDGGDYQYGTEETEDDLVAPIELGCGVAADLVGDPGRDPETDEVTARADNVHVVVDL